MLPYTVYGGSMDAAQIEKYEQLGMNVHYYRRKKKLTQDDSESMWCLSFCT